MTNNELPRRVAGAALLTAPLLMFGAVLTSPPQDDESLAGYIASLAADWNLSILSANLFHYYWVVLAVALPALLTLVRGRRGSVLTAIGVMGAVLGAVQMSGVLFADWMNAAMPTVVTMDQSVAIAEKVNGSTTMSIWLLSGIVLGVGMPSVAMAGLARNGVIGWWATPTILLPMIAAPVVGGMAGGLAGSIAAALCCAPLVVVALRLLRRTSADVTAALAPAIPSASA